MLKILFLLLFCFISLNATTIKEAIKHALINNPEISSLQSNTNAYRYYIDEAKGGYLPNISLDSYLEEKNTIRKYRNGLKTDVDQGGYYMMFKLDQPLYDGGLTKAKIAEARYNFNKARIDNITKTEDVIFNVVDTYLQLVKFEELYELTQNNLLIHENYLEIAKQSEDVSGVALDRLQVESKLNYAHSKFVQMKNDKESASSTFFKMARLEPKGYICRPEIDYKKVPASLAAAVNKSLKSNYTILSQIESLKAQREIINQEESRFYPVFSIQLSEMIDDNLDTKDLYSTTKSAKFKMTYNFFNGLKDKAVYERERIFLNESQRVLDDVTNGVIEKVKIAYSTYSNTKEKVEYLKTYVLKNKEVLKIYKEQFMGGTRTFIDILNNEAELYRAKTELIDEEFQLTKSYYQLMVLFSELSNTVLSSNNQICHELVVDKEEIINVDKAKDTASELDGLLEESTAPDPVVNEEENKKVIINEMLDNLMLEIYDKKEYKKKLKDELNKSETNDTIDGIEEIKIETTNDISTSSVVFPRVKSYSLKDVMLQKNENYYTIILATVDPSLDYNKFIEDNGIKYNAVAYNFGQKDKYVKIIFGAYKTYEDAFEALIHLNTNLLANRPYVERVSKHIKLFHKYDNTIED